MLTRCENKNSKPYKRYGGAGIKVCHRWHIFQNFIADMGLAPEGRSIDRRNGLKGYSPSNCRWATSKEQARNSRKPVVLTMDGVSKNISEWAAYLGVSQSTLSERLKKWPIEEALSKRKQNRWSRIKRCYPTTA